MLRPRTRTAIAAVRAAGIPFIVVTGRMFQSACRYLTGDEPVVCYQGAVVAEPTTGRFLRHEPIPLELARETMAALAAEPFHVNCYVGDELYVAEVTPEARAYADPQFITIHPVGDLLAWLEEPPTKLVVVGEPVALDDLEERMKARYGQRLYISKSLPYFLEFASPEVTKASGTAFLAEHMGFARERTVALGDGENDVELLEWAGYAVAVEAAHERVLAVADLVCPGPEDEGVAQVLDAFLDSRG